MALTFSNIIKQELTDFWQDKAFTYLDLMPLADKHYKKSKCVSSVLKNLADDGKLKITGKRKHLGRGTPTNVYIMIQDVPLFDKKVSKFNRAAWERQQTAYEEHMTQCAMRLNAVLDSITRNT